MLQRRDKRRYLLLYVNDQIVKGLLPLEKSSINTIPYTSNPQNINKDNNIPNNSQDRYKKINTIFSETNKKNNNNNNKNPILGKIIKKRFSELFGSIEFEKASLNVVYKQNFSFRNCIIIKCNLKSIDKVLFAISFCNPPLTTIKISGSLKKLISYIEV